MKGREILPDLAIYEWRDFVDKCNTESLCRYVYAGLVLEGLKS